MTNEKEAPEWWRAYTQLLHFADGSVEVNVHEKDIPKIVAEAERKGEMKALENIRDLLETEAKDRGDAGIWFVISKIERLLTSLKTP